MKRLRSLDIKYSMTQMLYFAAFAGIMGYATNYLLGKGISESYIGITLSFISVIACLTQPALASFADKHKDIEIRYLIIIFTLIAIAISLLMAILPVQGVIVLVLFVGISTALQTIMPLMNQLAFVFNKYGIEVNYGIARGLGSAAYAFAALGIGKLVDVYGTNFIPFIYIVFNILLVIICYFYVIPKSEMQEVSNDKINDDAASQQLSYVEFFKKYKRFMLFVLAVIVVYFTHTIINNFMIKIITQVNGNSSHMGTAVFIAAMAELPAMFGFNKLREKLGCATLLKISAIAFLVKHLITFFATSVTMIYVAQITQALAYAPLIPAGVYYVTQVISDNDAVKGQSMFTLAMTASGIIANALGGILIQNFGIRSVLLVGCIVSVIGVCVMFISLEDIR